jgi:hypothetical protein
LEAGHEANSLTSYNNVLKNLTIDVGWKVTKSSEFKMLE